MKKFLSILTAVFMAAFLIPSTSPQAQQSKAPDFVQGKLSGKLTKDMNGVYKFFSDNKVKFGVENPEVEFSEITSKEDNLGFKHIKTQQMVNGIPVYGNEYIVHFNKDNEVYAVNGSFDPAARKAKPDKAKFIKPEKAIDIAKCQVQFDELEMEPTAKLYLYNTGSEYVPVYEVRLSFIYPEPGDWHIFVDAVKGSIVHQYNRVAGAVSVTGSGKGVLGDTKTLNLTQVTTTSKKTTQTQYQLLDSTRPAVISTYTANNGTRAPGSLVYSTTTTVNDPAAVDAHYYAGVVYDYYNAVFGRTGIDNRNMAMKSTVHYGRNYVNAFWSGTQMVYGDGDGVQSVALSGGLDVIGHEMTHGVDDYEANLIYENQSGALNESLSDAFGTFIEFYGQSSKAEWLIGEDIWTPKVSGDALRSMADPTKYGDPDNMSKYVYAPNTQAGDWGGVHTNSGIPNKACYLTATNSAVGIVKAQQIYYRGLCSYLTSSSDFHAARLALAQAAADLYGAGSAEVAAVNSAWTAVGVN
ncbi:MAG: M4 family metallopeptidase [Bacillota bacterium]|nr:M4 family metallopeptidase [Bacillota bacterium]